MEQEEIKKQIELEIEKEKARAKAEAETKEIANIVKDTSTAIQVKLNERAAERIATSEEIGKKIDQTTEALVDMGLETQKNQVETELKKSQKDKAKAEFELSEDQYRAFGQDTSPKEEWKKWIIKAGYNVWFCILAFACFFTLAPFYIFSKIIATQKGVLKVIAIVTGVVLLLLCLTGLTIGCLKWTGVIG